MKHINWTKKISDHGITFLRIWLGLMMIKYSSDVLFADDGEFGLVEFSAWIETLGVPFSNIMGPISKYGEFLGGISLVVGAFTRLGASIITINLMVATIIVNGGKIFTSDELAFNYTLISLAVFLYGPGKFSVDNFLFKNKENA